MREDHAAPVRVTSLLDSMSLLLSYKVRIMKKSLPDLLKQINLIPIGLLVLLLGSLGLNLVGITWGLPAEQSWSNDDIAPLGPLKAAYDRFLTFTKYPPVHYVLLALVYAPYMCFLLLTGGLTSPTAIYPYGFTDPNTALSICILLARITSAFMGVGIVYFAFRATCLLGMGYRAALIAGTITAFNAYVLLFSHLSNVDVPSLFWLSISFCYFLRLQQGWKTRDAILLGLAAALALGTKEQIYSYLVGFALLLLVPWWRAQVSIRPLATGFVSFLFTYVLTQNLILGWSGYVERLQHWIGGPGVANWVEFEATVAGQIGLANKFLGQLVDGVTWPVALACIGGIGIAVRNKREILLPLLGPAIFYYVGTIALIRFTYPRFTMPCILAIAPLVGLFLSNLLEGKRLRRCLALGIILFAALGAVHVDTGLLMDSRYDAEAYLRSRAVAGSTIEVYSFPTYLPRFQPDWLVQRLDPGTEPARLFTSQALEARSPDFIVLSSNFFPRFGPPLDDYFESLRAGHFHYKGTVFRGRLSQWFPAPHSSQRFARVSPTIWVLERY